MVFLMKKKHFPQTKTYFSELKRFGKMIPHEIIAREKNKIELTQQTQYLVVVALAKGGSAHMSKRNSRYTVYGIDIMLWYVDHHGPCTS